MSGISQSWLVALRELRERSRSRAFRASVIAMVVVVAGVIIAPALLDTSTSTKDVGISGSTPAALAPTIEAQSRAFGKRARIHRYDDLARAEHAVRGGEIDVLVVDGRRLEWQRQNDEQLRAVVTGAIQLLAVRERAAAAGISPDAMTAILAPVPVTNVELGRVAGRTRDDETAALIMTVLLFLTIATYGAMVLSGVVEEKSSRVVEVLLARMPARNLLAGKIAGIGLLGLAQITLTAVVALVAATLTDAFDVPAVRGATLAWIVVWFVLGYALYATTFGALGSLTSRAEDAQSVAGPVSIVLGAAYLIAFATIGSPSTAWARAVSYFPVTAPLAMPNRIAMGAASWWEPLVAVALALVAIAALVWFGGRVYSRAALHTGATLKLRDVWTGEPSAARPGARTMGPDVAVNEARAPRSAVEAGASRRRASAGAIVLAVVVGGIVILATSDVIIGIAVGAAVYTVGRKVARLSLPKRSNSSPR
jgi:ABC-2 type transport system permease protein